MILDLVFKVKNLNNSINFRRVKCSMVSMNTKAQFSLFFGGRRKKKEDIRKKNKVILNSACRNVGRRFLARVLNQFVECLPMRSSI